MRDSYGREIDYMRISITDRCNLRCSYCMPEGIRCLPMEEILTLEEICEVAEAAAGVGIRHLKVTGGEPLVRRGCAGLVRMLKQIPGIETVTLTTNGLLLEAHLEELLAAGLDAVNISLDTLDPQLYQKITGQDGAAKVMQAVRLAVQSGIPVKINAVSLELGQDKREELVRIARELPVDVRFIEMMPIGLGTKVRVLDHRRLLQELQERYPGLEREQKRHGYGPAVYYRIPGYQGTVGLISAIHGKFCASCNRIRLTSTGYMKSCLCYADGVDLKKILRQADQGKERGQREPFDRNEQLQAAIRACILNKPAAHCFEQAEQVTEAATMSAIGG